MTVGEAPSSRVVDDPDATRTRRAWRIAGIGAGAGIAVALLTGVLGASGRVGLVVLLLCCALACGLGALYAIVTVVVDDLRGEPTSRRRPVAAAVLFALAAVLMAMVAGAGG